MMMMVMLLLFVSFVEIDLGVYMFLEELLGWGLFCVFFCDLL